MDLLFAKDTTPPYRSVAISAKVGTKSWIVNLVCCGSAVKCNVPFWFEIAETTLFFFHAGISKNADDGCRSMPHKIMFSNSDFMGFLEE